MTDTVRRYPDYCPDDLKEDEECPACGANEQNKWACGARHNGPRPRPDFSIICVHKDDWVADPTKVGR